MGVSLPLLVTADGEVVDGEVRLEAARELGLAEAPVIVQDDLTPTQVRTFRLLVNRSATWADWNDEALRAEMAELRLELDNLSLTGFSDRELDAFLAGTVADNEKDPDAVPEEPEVPTSVVGDVWLLGMHRLMCGDSTRPADVAALMAGEQADMVWTDPPYNVDYKAKAGKIKNDKMSPEQFDAFLRRMMISASDILCDGGAIYVAHSEAGHPRVGQCLAGGLRRFHSADQRQGHHGGGAGFDHRQRAQTPEVQTASHHEACGAGGENAGQLFPSGGPSGRSVRGLRHHADCR